MAVSFPDNIGSSAFGASVRSAFDANARRGRVWILTTPGTSGPKTLREVAADSLGEVIHSAASPRNNFWRLGGGAKVMWAIDSGTERAYNIDPSDLSVRSSNRLPWPATGWNFADISGDDNVILFVVGHYLVRSFAYRIDPATSSVIRTRRYPSSRSLISITGDHAKVWGIYDSRTTRELVELDPQTLAIIGTATMPVRITPYLIGGGATRLYGYSSDSPNNRDQLHAFVPKKHEGEWDVKLISTHVTNRDRTFTWGIAG